MPYKVNGKFVSKAVYEEHQAALAAETREENNMSEYDETAEDAAEVFEEATADRRRGPRATTLFKKAANKKTAAEVKLLKAKNKLAKFDHGRDELEQAVEDAQAELDAAAEELEEAADNL